MRRSSFLFVVFLTAFTFMPLISHAASATFFGPIIPTACNCANVTGPGGTVPESGAAWGCVLQVLQNLMNFAVSLGAIIITLYIVWAGVAYVLSPINAEGRQKAKSRLLNAVLGLFVMLAAWLFIDSIMKVIYNSNAYGPWNSILNPNGAADCIAPTIFTPSANIANNNSNGGPPVAAASSTAPSGTCGSTTHLDCAAAVSYIDAHAGSSSNGACLASVQLALEAGGLSMLRCPATNGSSSNWAGQCNGPLGADGFTSLGSSDGSPQAGDIGVFQHTAGNMIGHIAMYDGTNWVSDFVQSSSESPPGNPYRSGFGGANYWRP
jgi:hypothetical protein